MTTVPIRQAVPGLVLVVAGVGLLLALRGTEAVRLPLPGAGVVVVTVIGAAALVAYVVTHSYGLLTAGAILTGLGTGLIAQVRYGLPRQAWWPWVLGVGLGLILIYAADRLATGRTWTGNWWPLLVGVVLCLIGAGSASFAGHGRTWQVIGTWWPILLVAIGLWSIWRTFRPAPSRS